jgi:hypothetical protein
MLELNLRLLEVWHWLSDALTIQLDPIHIQVDLIHESSLKTSLVLLKLR